MASGCKCGIWSAIQADLHIPNLKYRAARRPRARSGIKERTLDRTPRCQGGQGSPQEGRSGRKRAAGAIGWAPGCQTPQPHSSPRSARPAETIWKCGAARRWGRRVRLGNAAAISKRGAALGTAVRAMSGLMRRPVRAAVKVRGAGVKSGRVPLGPLSFHGDAAFRHAAERN